MFCDIQYYLFGCAAFYGWTFRKMSLDDEESIERRKRFYWQAMVIYSKLERFTELIIKMCYYSVGFRNEQLLLYLGKNRF